MSSDYLEIGAGPSNEPCAQVGDPDYYDKVHEECKRYIQLIREKLGPEPEGTRLRIKSFMHDFGVYYEVVCHYDENSPESVDYAFACEMYSPATWSDNDPVNWKEQYQKEE